MISTSNSPRPSGSVRKRVRLLTTIFTVILSVYLFYLFNLQVVHGSTYLARARRNAEHITTIPAERGKIYDRNMRLLAANRPSYEIDLIPAEATRHGIHGVLERLSTLLHMTTSSIMARLPVGWPGIYRPVKIRGGVPFSTITYIAEHVGEFPGVSWQNRPVRYYPATGSISHVIGYVGDITRQQLQVLYNQGYNQNSIVGEDGVEQEYDGLLRGKAGKQLQVVDANGRPVPGKHSLVDPPKDGRNLVLTIDSRWETLAEQALGPRTGSVIILKPSTGAILAMASYPWYMPNTFYGKNGSGAMKKALLNPKFPFINRAIQSVYAPASTFKIIETAADYWKRWLPPSEKIDTTGSMKYGGRIWHDWNPKGFGWIGLQLAFAHSSDQYFWDLGTKYMGIQRIIKYARMFGLGKKTGIDLPGEVSGLVPTPKWKQQNLNRPWVGGDTMSMAIGQGYLQVTPIQMADVAAMVVNKGVVYRPHVLAKVIDPVTGHVIRAYRRKVLFRSPIPKPVFTKVQQAMRADITRGTAGVVMTERAVKIGSKTGTGQTGVHHHWTSWFVSYGPYGAKPSQTIVVVVMVEAKNLWEWWGPKAADIIYQGIFDHQTFWPAVHTLEPVWYLNKWVVGPFDDITALDKGK